MNSGDPYIARLKIEDEYELQFEVMNYASAIVCINK